MVCLTDHPLTQHETSRLALYIMFTGPQIPVRFAVDLVILIGYLLSVNLENLGGV